MTLEQIKEEKKAMIRAEYLGLVDAYFGGQRGKNSAIAHAILELYEHVEILFRLSGIDTQFSPEYKKLLYDKARLQHFDNLTDCMYNLCNQLNNCVSEDCIKKITPGWPDKPRKEDYGIT